MGWQVEGPGPLLAKVLEQGTRLVCVQPQVLTWFKNTLLSHELRSTVSLREFKRQLRITALNIMRHVILEKQL